jgi:hypothetical protein
MSDVLSAVPAGRQADSRQGFIHSLPLEFAALRKVLEAWPELVDWIDPAAEPPERPLVTKLRQFLHTEHTRRLGAEAFRVLRRILEGREFFDVADLTLPKLQFAAWKYGRRIGTTKRGGRWRATGLVDAFSAIRRFTAWLVERKEIPADPFAGEVLQEWAKGNFSCLERTGFRAFHFLCQIEDVNSKTGVNREAVLVDWHGRSEQACREIDPGHYQTIPAGAERGRPLTAEETKKGCAFIAQHIFRARATLESPPGMDSKWAKRLPKGPIGTPEAHGELILFWKPLGTRWIRLRWNPFPDRVRIALAVANAHATRDIATDRRGSQTINGLAGKTRRRLGKTGTSAGHHRSNQCPRLAWVLRRIKDGDDFREAARQYELLDTGVRQGICAQHTGDLPGHIFLRQLLREFAAGQVQEVKPFYSRACAALDPKTALEKFRQRGRQDSFDGSPRRGRYGGPTRAFGVWCEERLAAVGSIPGVTNEIFRAAEETDRAKLVETFGGYDPLAGVQPGRRGKVTERVRRAIQQMKEEHELERRADAISAEIGTALLEGEAPRDDRLAGHVDGTREEKHVPPLAGETGKKKPPPYEWLTKALLTRKRHPEWSLSEVAREVGVAKSTLSKCDIYRRAAGLDEAPRDRIPRGYKDPETGEFDAWKRG